MELFSVIPQALGKTSSPTFAGLNIFGTSTPTLTIESSDASDPTLIFKTTNTTNQLNISLDESQAEDFLRIEGQTASVDTIISIRAQDGENATLQLKSGAITSFIRMTSGDDLLIKNTAADHDISFQITDGAVQKTITWDADVDKLKHSTGTFDFDNDNITTTGRGTFTDFTVPGNSVFGLNSSVFQPNTDSTTFFQVLDADGGTPVFNVDTVNGRVGIGTMAPVTPFHVEGGAFNIPILRISGGGSYVDLATTPQIGRLKIIGATEAGLSFELTEGTAGGAIFQVQGDEDYVGIVRGANRDVHFFQDAITGENTSIRIYGYPTGGANDFARLRMFGTTTSFEISTNRAGSDIILKPAAEVDLLSATPYFNLRNSTHEDSDGGRESRLNFKGEQSGGEETTLARIEISHDSVADDQLGKEVHSINTGAGLVEAMRLDSNLAAFFTKIKLTEIGGYAIKLTNKTGGNTVAGQLVVASFPLGADTDDAFETAAANEDNVIGVVLDAGIADGSEAWIVVSGIADVLMDGGGSARGDRIISSVTAGSADVWNVGGAVATHFLEIGHCIETRTGAGLARCVLHFN